MHSQTIWVVWINKTINLIVYSLVVFGKSPDSSIIKNMEEEGYVIVLLKEEIDDKGLKFMSKVVYWKRVMYQSSDKPEFWTV